MDTPIVLGLLDPKDYPEEQKQLVYDFNRKLLLISERNARLTSTISKKEQFRQTLLAEATRVYNINITKGMIEDEIYEFREAREFPVLESLGLTCPCPLEVFINRSLKTVKDECREDFREHFDRESLLEGYRTGERSRNLEYVSVTPWGTEQFNKHTIFMTIEPGTGDLIANCCSKDIFFQSSMMMVYEALEAGMWNMFFSPDCEMLSCSWSDSYRKMIGYTDRDEFPDDIHSWENIIYEEDRIMVMESYWNAVRNTSVSGNYDVEYRIKTKDQGVRWFHSVGKIARRSDGSPTLFVGLIMDIDDEKRANEQLKTQLRIVNALSRDYHNIFSIDLSKKTARIIQLNGYVTTGLNPKSKGTYPYDALCMQYIRDRVYEDDREMMLEAMSLENVKKCLAESEEYISSYRVVYDGGIHYFQFTYTLLYGDLENGEAIVAFKNIDSVINAAKERDSLITLSETDQMTGLLNRATGERKSAAKIASGKGGMLCIIDVDKFKSVNDTYGHNVGDKVLISIANCLKKAFRDADIVFRLGGDEMAAYACSVDSVSTGKRIMNRLFDYIDEIDIPELGDRKVTISVGAIIVDDDSNYIFEDAYKLADSCVYQSKKSSENAITFWGSEDI